MDVEVQNKFLVPFSFCCLRKQLIYISPSEILLYHLSLCDSSVFDPVVKYMSAVRWFLPISSPKRPFFLRPVHDMSPEQEFHFQCPASIVRHLRWFSLIMSLEEEILTWVSSVTSWQSFFYYPLKTFSCHDCGWMRSGWMWSLLCLQKGGLLGKVVHCHPLGLLGRNE